MTNENLTPTLISGVSCYERDGTAYLKLEDVARGLGFTQTKNGLEYIRWETIDKYLRDFGFSQQVGKDSYIPENIFYRLAMKAKNETAEKFQALVADEIIPSRAVIGAIGGKDTPAYIDNHVRGKVYSECNHDVQGWFRVNSVGNISRKRFDEAVEYIQRWKPSTNTVMLIQQTNGQTSLFERGA